MTDLAERLALSLVLADTRFCRDYSRWEPNEGLKAVAGLALLPYLSAYAVDSSRYLSRSLPDMSEPLGPHRSFLSMSRLRAKLFDDTWRGFEGAMTLAGEAAARYSEWFYRSRFAFLREGKRRHVPDLALFLLDGQLLSTSHVAFLNLGMDAKRASDWSPKLINREVASMGEGVGRYTRSVLELLDEPVDVEAEESSPSPLVLTSKDVRSEEVYGAMQLREGPPRLAAAVVLTSLLCAANTALLLTPALCAGNGDCETKAQYVTLFHVTSCLGNLLASDSREGMLTPTARQRLNELLGKLPGKSKARADLRNVLMHYRIGGSAAGRLCEGKPMFGLVEAHLDGLDHMGLRREIRAGLRRATQVLSELVIPGLSEAPV